MCGISGIINKDSSRVAPHHIKTMNDLIIHRGPDDEGYYFGEHFALGHRRLSILDLSSDGHQPMAYLDKYLIVYNGEIYNYLEIKDELIRVGYRFVSKTDTEVILAAYHEWGVECVTRFNGMWSFALYDKERNIIFCSRDRFGVKPFYYSDDEATFIFGSEIKQLLCNKKDGAVANINSIRDFLIEGYSEHTSQTFFENVLCLQAGHNLIYSLANHSFEISRYYSLNIDPALLFLNEKMSIKHFFDTLNRSIRYRMRSDVKVGTCLSGGLDSSSIAKLASEMYHEQSTTQFQAVHAKTADKKLNEDNYAQELADHCNIDLCMIEPSIEDFTSAINEVIYCQEEPFISPSVFVQFFVFKKAKEINCKVMLDGQGGDEILLGYERYFPAYLRSLPISESIQAFVKVSKNSRLSAKELFGYIFYFTISKIRVARIKQKFFFIKDEYLKEFSSTKKFNDNYLDITNLQKLEIESLQLPHLLRYEDKNSMWHSVEARLPFLDYKLVETALGINNSFKIKDGWTKYILRKAMDCLIPKNIAWRKNKLGFEAPDDMWTKEIRTEMESTIFNSALLSHMSKHQINLTKLDKKTYWKLYSIAKWENIYRVQVRAPSGEMDVTDLAETNKTLVFQ